jgi:hypothetical protein
MMRLRRASAIVVLSLVAAAATASAECAWVLWQQDITIRGGDPPGKLNQGFLIVRASRAKRIVRTSPRWS